MIKLRIFVGLSLVLIVLTLSQPVSSSAQTSTHAAIQATATDRDGSRDFDWDIGTWKTHQKRLLHPLTGSTTWVEYSGTDVVQRVWGGANAGKIEADGSAGHLEIYTLRLYDPDAHQWNIYFATSAGGSLSKPVVGVFKDGSGEFYDQEPYQGKQIFVRFRVYDITATTCRFDQSFSADGGKTWEPNFVVDETLVKPLKSAEAEGPNRRPAGTKT